MSKRPRANTGCLSGLLYFLFVVGISALLTGFGWLSANEVLGLSKPEGVVTITVKAPVTIGEVADDLKEKGVIQYTWLFTLYAGVTDAEADIKPGTYEIRTNFDYMAIVHAMDGRSDDRVVVKVVIPEGYTMQEIFAVLEENKVSTAAKLWETARSHTFPFDFLEGLPEADDRLEGYLFPDTYEFYVNENPVDVLSKMLMNFDRKFTDDMREYLDGTDYTMREIVIIASMIEKEAAGADDAPLISSVILNRLRSDRFPCLQIDATILYVLPEHKTQLTQEDLRVDSPYNTYIYPGLPPGPIASPGKSSLMAALEPEDTDYYYYAVNKDGVHQFSRTKAEHDQIVEEAKRAGRQG
ncbi:MAG: endolytic transglycosylase MltG [Oscillospiraceae bacterium]|nr:endolytic transglycosylase MltG [Oscillospiraceae bacterium]